jgi:copper resistance protein B
MNIELPLALGLLLGGMAVAQAADEHAGHAGHSAPAASAAAHAGHQPPAAAPAMDHAAMQQKMQGGHCAERMQKMQHAGMDHAAMQQKMQGGHCADRMQKMQHAGMDHSQHAMPMMEHSQHAGHGAAPVPVLTAADRAAAFPPLPPHAMHPGGINYLFVADQLEWQDADEGSTLAWDIHGWIGGDIDRFAFRAEGERVAGSTHEAELQLLWSHAISRWWESVLGVRQDFKPGEPQSWLAAGVQGMPLYAVETEATLFLGEAGQSALRLGAEYDLLLTQRLILQPALEANLYGRTDEQRGIGSGFSDLSAGLRLRYELSRQFAPYVGVEWGRVYGNTADLLAPGEDASETKLVAGVRFWF